jgi:hypothetical protein
MAEQGIRPYVQIAAICQAALQEANGFISIIRVIDRLPVPGRTEQMPPFPLHQLCLAVVLKSGEMSGKYTLKIIPETPSGKRLPAVEMPALFERDERGVALVMPLGIIAEEEGLYWFDVTIEQDVLTRIPLRVMYQKLPPMPGFPFPGQQPG